MVFNAPYSFEKMEKIYLFFKGLDWLLESMWKNVIYSNMSNVDYNKAKRIIDEDKNSASYLKEWSQEVYLKKIKEIRGQRIYSFNKKLIKLTKCK